MSEDVKPCPFCGNPEPELERIGNRHQSALVVCGQCGARMESCDEGEDSFDSWNRRVPSPLPDAACDWLIYHDWHMHDNVRVEEWIAYLPFRTGYGDVDFERTTFDTQDEARAAARQALTGDPS